MAASRDPWARAILAGAWAKYGTPTPAALQAAQAIAHVESGGGYGAIGTSDPKWAGSNNWGAIRCNALPPCPAGCFEHGDADEHGNRSSYCFRKYDTPELGAAGLLHELMRRPRVPPALATGDARAIAEAMRAPPAYFALSAKRYAELIAEHAKKVAANVGEPLYVTLGSSPAPSEGGMGDLLFWSFVAWAAWQGVKKR